MSLVVADRDFGLDEHMFDVRVNGTALPEYPKAVHRVPTFTCMYLEVQGRQHRVQWLCRTLEPALGAQRREGSQNTQALPSFPCQTLGRMRTVLRCCASCAPISVCVGSLRLILNLRLILSLRMACILLADLPL